MKNDKVDGITGDQLNMLTKYADYVLLRQMAQRGVQSRDIWILSRLYPV